MTSLTSQQLEDRITEALHFLTSSDEQLAQLKHEADRAEAMYQATIDALFLTCEGTVEDRKASARTDKTARHIHDDYLAAVLKFDKLKNKRTSEALVIEACRSLLVERRKGL